VHTDIGKLLFPDGIYDFKTGVFSTQFDPSIVFTGRMPRPFPVKNQALVDEIRKISFIQAIADEETRSILLHSLMRGFIGDVLRKKFIFGTGWGNSGKGMIATLIHTCMGMLCSDFNGNNLIYRSMQGESAREYGWLLGNVRSRIAIGSEVRMKNADKTPNIDGVLIKSISSGVDKLNMRDLHKSEVGFVNKATFFMFAQDIPNITPAEKTTLDRLISVEWSYSYVANPTLPHERLADPNLAYKYADATYGDAFFWLMVEEYEKWRETGFAEPVMSEVVMESRNNFVDEVDYRSVLEDAGYKIGDQEKFVLFKDLSSLFQCGKPTLGRNLKALGLVKADKKINKKTETIYYGIEKVESS
jgi:phage/plasmid-associated DNA primase